MEKSIGNAVMGVLGSPTATEDDAERAVRAALNGDNQTASRRVRRASARTGGGGEPLRGPREIQVEPEQVGTAPS